MTYPLVHRLGLSLLLFSGSLTLLLFLSWLFVLPRFTQFVVQGEERPATALIAEREALERKLREALEKRDRLLLPVHDETYAMLRRARDNRASSLDIWNHLRSRAAAAAGSPAAIALEEIAIDTRANTVRLAGDVRNVGPRSMTILAQFTEALRGVSFVASLTPPAFTREEEKDGTFHSPFSLAFSLRPSASNTR